MSELGVFLESLNGWHWLGLALVILALEMALGTYDLLWIAVAAAITALWKALPLPGIFDSWQASLIVFSFAAVALVVLGRTIFSDWRKPPETHPTLNKRGEGLVGTVCTTSGEVSAQSGRVTIGDTEWMARSHTGLVIAHDTKVRIVSADGTLLTVEPIGAVEPETAAGDLPV